MDTPDNTSSIMFSFYVEGGHDYRFTPESFKVDEYGEAMPLDDADMSEVFPLGGSFDPEKLSKLLGLTPTRSWTAGQQRPEIEGLLLKEESRYSFDYWCLDFDEDESADPLNELLDTILPLKDKILEFCRENNVKAGISCLLDIVEESAPVIEFGADVLKRLAETGLSLSFDMFIDSGEQE